MADGSVYKWLIVVAGLMLLFQMGGINTVSGKLLDEFGNNFENFKFSNLFDTIEDAILASVGAAIVVGFLFRRSPESAILVAYASLLLFFVADLITIYGVANDSTPWIGKLASLLLVPVAIGYAHSVVSWWGQR